MSQLPERGPVPVRRPTLVRTDPWLSEMGPASRD